MNPDDHFYLAHGHGWFADLAAADKIAIAAALVALLSLFATLWFAFLTRRHNRLSVRPYIDHFVQTSPSELVSFKLLNAGIGPAIIRRCTYVLDGESHPIKDQTFPKNIEDALRSETVNAYANFVAIAPHTCIPAGQAVEAIVFLKPEGIPVTRAAHAAQCDFVERFAVEVEYESMYGEKQPIARLGPKKKLQ